MNPVTLLNRPQHPPDGKANLASLADHPGVDSPQVARKLRRAILLYLFREEKVVEGPTLRPRWRVLRAAPDAGPADGVPPARR